MLLSKLLVCHLALLVDCGFGFYLTTLIDVLSQALHALAAEDLLDAPSSSGVHSFCCSCIVDEGVVGSSI